MAAKGLAPGALKDATGLSFRRVECVLRGDSVGAETVLQVWKAVGGSFVGLVEEVRGLEAVDADGDGSDAVGEPEEALTR